MPGSPRNDSPLFASARKQGRLYGSHSIIRPSPGPLHGPLKPVTVANESLRPSH